MKNLGPVSTQWLAEIGIHTLDDLRAAGAVPTYRQLKEMVPDRVSLNLLWGLEAAVRGIDWRDLTEADKADLRRRLSRP
jgi:hypothetical protein